MPLVTMATSLSLAPCRPETGCDVFAHNNKVSPKLFEPQATEPAGKAASMLACVTSTFHSFKGTVGKDVLSY